MNKVMNEGTLRQSTERIHGRAIRDEIKREFMVQGKSPSSHVIEIERNALIRMEYIKRLIHGD